MTNVSDMLKATQRKYRLPYHWMRDRNDRPSLPYFGYMQIVLEELPSDAHSVFDAGCNDGRIAAEIVDSGRTVTGMDMLDSSVRYARQLVPKGRFYTGDLANDIQRTCEIAPNSFDAAIMIEVYEHMPPELCEAALRNIRNILRPGGCFIISVPTHKMPFSSIHYRHFSEDEILRELRNAGFAPIRRIFQHRMNWLGRMLLSDRIDRLIANPLIRFEWARSKRSNMYMRFANRVPQKHSAEAGRIIVVAQQQA